MRGPINAIASGAVQFRWPGGNITCPRCGQASGYLLEEQPLPVAQSFPLLPGPLCILFYASPFVCLVNKKQRKKREKQARYHADNTADRVALTEHEGADINQTTESRHPENESKGKKNPFWWGEAIQWTNNYSNAIIAIFTAVLAVMAFGQACIYTKQLDVLRDQLIISSRPYISFTGFNGSKPELLNGEVADSIIFVKWNNPSTSPTVNGKLTIGHSVLPFTGFRASSPASFDHPDQSDMPIVAGPKSDGSIAAHVPIEAIQAVEHIQASVFLWGWVIYQDAFPETPKHLTEFCFQIQSINITNMPPAKQEPNFRDASLNWTATDEYCPNHNCYDNNCPDYAEKTK